MHWLHVYGKKYKKDLMRGQNKQIHVRQRFLILIEAWLNWCVASNSTLANSYSVPWVACGHP